MDANRPGSAVLSFVASLKTRTIVLWALALLPFFAAVTAHAIGPRPRIPMAGAKRPALVADQYLNDLGEVEPERVILGYFGFRNAGSEPLRITELVPSCGCLKPRLKQRTYAPGEHGEFYIRVQAANEEPGPQEYFVDLKYEDPEPRTMRLTLKLTLPEQKIVIRPKALIFYQLARGTTSQDVVITDYRSFGIEPLAVTSSAPELASVEIAKVDEDAEGHRRIRLTVTAADAPPPGWNRVLVEVRTDDPENSPLRIPLMIQGAEPQPSRTATRPEPESAAPLR